MIGFINKQNNEFEKTKTKASTSLHMTLSTRGSRYRTWMDRYCVIVFHKSSRGSIKYQSIGPSVYFIQKRLFWFMELKRNQSHKKSTWVMRHMIGFMGTEDGDGTIQWTETATEGCEWSWCCKLLFKRDSVRAKDERWREGRRGNEAKHASRTFPKTDCKRSREWVCTGSTL